MSTDPYDGLVFPTPVDGEPWEFEKAVETEVRRIRVREAAHALVAAEHARDQPLPSIRSLRGFLAEPDPPVAYRVEGAWPAGGRIVFSAQNKAGKTTVVGNLLRALADGEPLFGAWDTVPAGRVVLLDNELDERMLRRWLRDHAIANTDAVDLLPMRGRLSALDVLNPSVRAAWARHLGPADVLILDCLRPALDALGLDENRDAGRFLEALDELTTTAGIAETLVVHHHGHTGERSRGDSRILDWPDAVWNLVRDNGNPATAARYFTAYGRDVTIAETRLDHNAATRRLTLAGGSRDERKTDDALEAILDVLDDAEPMSGREVERALEDSGHGRATVREALRRGVSIGLITTTPGPQRSNLHTLNQPSAPVRHHCAASAPGAQ